MKCIGVASVKCVNAVPLIKWSMLLSGRFLDAGVVVASPITEFLVGFQDVAGGKASFSV